MTEEFNYSHIPVEFPYCFERNCTKYEECLHGCMCKYLTAEPHIITTVNPLQTCTQGDCPHFKTTEKVRYAKGMSRTFDNLPHKAAQSIKRILRSHFGNSEFYRFHSEGKPLKPHQQEYVHHVFRLCGVEEEPVYDVYYDAYVW